jgi:DNA-binding MarR family transcriptional regulator
MARHDRRRSTCVRVRDEELRAWQALLHAHYDLVRRLDLELRAEQRITLDAYDVLLRLARADGRTLRMSELAERVMIPRSTLTRRVDALVADGLVERFRDRDDSRVIYARLSASGLDRVRSAAQTHLRGIHEHFTSRLTDTQLGQVAEALEVITGPHTPH